MGHETQERRMRRMKGKAIRFLEVKNIKGRIDDFGGFGVSFETEKGRFRVTTDKLHHPEWYGMVDVDFADESVRHSSLEDETVSGHAWTNDERVIAALAQLTSREKSEIDIKNPTKEAAREVYERLKIPNAPSGDGMLTQMGIFGNADYLGKDGTAMDRRDAEIERHMVDSGMTREQAEARVGE